MSDPQILEKPEQVKVCVKCWEPGEMTEASPCPRCGCTAHWVLDKPEHGGKLKA